MIEVYSPGSQVEIDAFPLRSTLASPPIHGTIVSVALRGGVGTLQTCYAVEWWDGRKIECREFDAYRVTPYQTGIKTVRVGFCDGSNAQ